MPSLRQTFPMDLPPSEVDAYRVCDWFKVNDPTGATQRAVAALLLPGRFGIASDLRQARDAINARLQVLAERAEIAPITGWDDSHEQALDVAARRADETCMPAGLTWSEAPDWAVGLVSTGFDAYNGRQLVWVPALTGNVLGANARRYRHMSRGRPQSCALGCDGSQWVIIATRPGDAVAQGGE